MTPHSDPGLAEEFRARPCAHSEPLKRLLNAFAAWPWRTSTCWSNCRTTALAESARLGATRDDPVELIAGAVFDRIEDAEWFVFKARWEQHFGQALQD